MSVRNVRVVFGAIFVMAVFIAQCPPAFAVSPCATAMGTCVVTPSSPSWVTVPGEQNGLEGQAFSQVLCRGTSRVAGADWTAPASNQLDVDLSLLQDGWPPPVGTFYATNSSPQPSTFAAFVGCVEQSSRGTAPAAGIDNRVKALRVRPGMHVTVSLSCRWGERLLRGGAAVVFNTRPSPMELHDHDYRYKVGARSVRVTLKAGRTIGDDERVTLQVHVVCGRRRSA